MKGNILDIPIILIVLFVFAIVVLTSFTILDKFGTIAGDNINQTYITQGENALRGFDAGFLLLVIGFFIGTIISAFFINSHPVFFIISFLGLIIMVTISTVFTNAFIEIASTPGLVDTGNQFPITVAVFQNWPILVTLLGGIILIVLFIKRGGGENV